VAERRTDELIISLMQEGQWMRDGQNIFREKQGDSAGRLIYLVLLQE